MKKIICHLIFSCIFGVLIFSEEKIMAPFVSKLTFEVSYRKVLLQWENPENFTDNISVYRSNTVIDTSVKLNKSEKIAMLKDQAQKYIDSPQEPGDYYYAVIITNKSSNSNYVVLVPYRNYTLKPAAISEEEYSKITKFNAKLNVTNIRLDWEYTTNSKEPVKIMIFRNAKPITNEDVLNSSIKITTTDIKSKTYFDSPFPDIEYYYAIFLEGDKDKKFIPDVNISTRPVLIEEKNSVFPNFSIDEFIPLPLLTIKKDPKTGKAFIDPQILKNPIKIRCNDNVEKIIEEYRKRYIEINNEYTKEKQTRLQHLDFRFLHDEEIYTPGEYSAEYKQAMSLIIDGKHDSALVILRNLINEILPEDLLIRISYYIGQIYYANSDYYSAYIYLILAVDNYRKEIMPFIDSIYQNIFYKLER